MGSIQDFILNLRQKPFIKSIINDLNGECYAIGGVVRDLILNKPNKDIDLIVRNVSIDVLVAKLQKFGKVDVVGKSFGVIKFVDRDGVDYDIALPRTETKNDSGGYRGFDVQSDQNLPIEDDLSRRDAKFNAMAININTGKFIDPLGGLEDIEKKQISAANATAFSEDPLRMLRIIGFASRFGFTIEPQTMQMIKDNATRIKEIPPERILTEFDKIVKKGNKRLGAQLLKDSGLFQQIFGFDIKQSVIDRSPFEDVRTMGEFIFLLTRHLSNPAEFYKNNLKGDINTYKEIKALQMAYDSGEATNLIEARSVAHNMYVTFPQSLQSQILPRIIEIAAQELLSGKYPKIIGELSVNGNDLMKLGYNGKEIGNTLKMILLKIYSGKLKNNRKDILDSISKKDSINEEKAERIEYGCLMLYLDVPIWNKITSIIDKNDIYDVKGYGIETEPHTTILYGFHDDVTPDEVFDLYRENMTLKPIEIGVDGISIFENSEFDVVKFGVKSKILTKLNKIMSVLSHTTDFPDYHAHITLAYVKKGRGKKYVKSFEKERKLTGNELVYTWKGHKGKENGKVLMLNEK